MYVDRTEDLDGDRVKNRWAAYLLLYCNTTGNVSSLATIVRTRNAVIDVADSLSRTHVSVSARYSHCCNTVSVMMSTTCALRLCALQLSMVNAMSGDVQNR
jgi:hypothetical protein